MTLIVEDGTGIAGSQVYGLTGIFDTASFLTDLKSYWDSVGYDYSNPAWTDAYLEQQANKGFRWANNEFRDRLPGRRLTGDQVLHFPAFEAYDVDGFLIEGIPVEAFQAGAEATYREATVPNSLTPDYQRAGDKSAILSRRKIGQIERAWEVPTLSGDVSDVKPRLVSVENILSRLIGRSTDSGSATKALKRS